MHHLKRSPCTMAAASMHNLAGHGAQFRRKRCAKAAELSPRLLHTLDAEVEHPRRRNWTENDTGSHCPEHWLWGAGTVALTRRTPGSEASEYSLGKECGYLLLQFIEAGHEVRVQMLGLLHSSQFCGQSITLGIGLAEL